MRTNNFWGHLGTLWAHLARPSHQELGHDAEGDGRHQEPPGQLEHPWPHHAPDPRMHKVQVLHLVPIPRQPLLQFHRRRNR